MDGIEGQDNLPTPTNSRKKRMNEEAFKVCIRIRPLNNKEGEI